MRALRPLAAAAACALAATGAARERPRLPGEDEEVRPLLAVRVAGAVPAGNARSRVPIGDLVAGAVPVGLELAARGGATTFGLAVEWGVGIPAQCYRNLPCSASVTRAGIELLHRFSPGQGSGWMGAGLGWERTTLTYAGRTTRYDSFELLNLQLGRDFAVGRRALLGPFVAATFAQAMEQDGQPIPQKSPHCWFQVGLRAELGL